MQETRETPSQTTDSRPVTEIVGALIHDFQDVFREAVRLAVTELRANARKAAKPAGMLATAALMGFFAFACFIMTCIVALAIVLPLWLAALLMGVLLAFGAGGAFLLGRVALQEIDFVPQKTVQTLRDIFEHIKARPSKV